jgi:hypothetical protein
MTAPPILAGLRAQLGQFLRLNPDFRSDAALLFAAWVRETAVHLDVIGARHAADLNIALAEDLRAFANRTEALAPFCVEGDPCPRP